MTDVVSKFWFSYLHKQKAQHTEQPLFCNFWTQLKLWLQQQVQIGKMAL